MLHSFTITDYPVHVHSTEIEAIQDPNILTAFVISLEGIYVGLHCDLIDDCSLCPIDALCSTTYGRLPKAVIDSYAPHLIVEYPEYFI